ncbi:App1 family protein [Zhouia sp. PK063]|uniref:App1 family protein n=1 Tax=Zhouia sp. PK063 TaxID=3373602 RepID=UPI0037969A6C
MKFDLKIYRGYANEHQVIIFGHVFRSLAPDAFVSEKNGLKHAWAVIKMFTIKTLKNAEVVIHFKNQKIKTYTLNDGYFRVCFPYENLEAGWHQFSVEATYQTEKQIAEASLLKPFPGKIGFISDIDDTFLISHSSNFFKKLYVLLTKNVNKRKIFEDVAAHYKLLSKAGRTDEVETNTFFYVSSSEWNLYQFIVDFTKLKQLPKAVLKLKSIKTGLGDFLFSGRGNHNHKFEKIKDILEFYPEMSFVLMGDDSQKDPFLYENLVKHFPLSIKAVYIRQTKKHPKQAVLDALSTIKSFKIPICYFAHSSKAIAHSRTIGIIN